MNSTPEYIPGACNIGPAEIKNRKKGGVFNTVFGIAVIIFLLVIHAAKPLRLILFFPATLAMLGYLQWYYKFCAGFGLKGVFNFGDMGKTYSVEQKEYFQKDRSKAWKMIITSLLFGFIMASLFYILPL
jgi:hypothetical protein